jgi:fatty-acid desaturase
MRKSILIVDWLLIIIFVIMVLSKFIDLEFASLLQPVFFVLIFIHIIQHWKIIVNSLKKLINK